MEQQDATPNDGGASVLDRLEQKLSADDAPEQEQTEAQESNPEPQEAEEVQVEPDDDGKEPVKETQLTTEDLAKVLGIDESALEVSEDGTLKLKTKIDGQEGAANLAELLKSYQLEGHVNKKSMEVAEREKALQTRAQEVESQAQARLEQVEALAKVAADELYREFQSIDWRSLEQTDPGQAALLRQKFQDRSGQLQGVFNEVEQNKASKQQQSAKQQQEFIAAQREMLPKLIPEWKDQAVATKESAEMREWGIKQGIPAQDLDNVALAHHVVVLRKAMLFDKLQTAKPAIENKVRIAPKLVKPGQAQQDTQAQAAKALRSNVIKSGGKTNSIAEYLIASGKV